MPITEYGKVGRFITSGAGEYLAMIRSDYEVFSLRFGRYMNILTGKYTRFRRCKTVIMERLQECRRMVKRTRWIDARLLELHSGTERTTSVQRKTPPETEDLLLLEEQLDKITGYERDYSTQLIEAMREIMEIDGWLQQLPERHEDIMRLRYIDARSWSEVAREVGYSEAHCYTLHHEAVALLEKIEQKNVNGGVCLKAAPLQTA